MNIHQLENGAIPSNRTRLTTDRKDIEVSSRILVGSIFTCNRGFSMPKPRDGYLEADSTECVHLSDSRFA